jgi:hypothetical protein
MSNRIENAEVYDYGTAEFAVQTPCNAGCEKGLLYAPARFCGACGGSGFTVRWATWRGDLPPDHCPDAEDRED